MPKGKRGERLTRHHINLHQGDIDRLNEYYPSLGASEVIRQLVRKHLAALDARVAAALGEKPKVEPITEVANV